MPDSYCYYCVYIYIFQITERCPWGRCGCQMRVSHSWTTPAELFTIFSAFCSHPLFLWLLLRELCNTDYWRWPLLPKCFFFLFLIIFKLFYSLKKLFIKSFFLAVRGKNQKKYFESRLFKMTYRCTLLIFSYSKMCPHNPS